MPKRPLSQRQPEEHHVSPDTPLAQRRPKRGIADRIFASLWLPRLILACVPKNSWARTKAGWRVQSRREERGSAVQFSNPLAVVTPTLDGPVLAALAAADGPFTTGQLTRVLSAGSEEGIRKVLRRLTAQGVLSAERVGPAFAYRLNRAHLAAGPIIALAGLRATFLTRLERLLASWAQPAAYAAVFGSASRSTMRPDSDIDLFLVRSDGPDDMWDTQLEHLVSMVSAWTGNDLRPLVYTLTELDAARGEPVLLDILDSGINVAGERSWFQRRVRPPRAR